MTSITLDKLYQTWDGAVGLAKLDTHSDPLFYKTTQTIIYYRELLHAKLYKNRMLNELCLDIVTDIMYWLSFTNVLDVHQSAQNRATNSITSIFGITFTNTALTYCYTLTFVSKYNIMYPLMTK